MERSSTSTSSAPIRPSATPGSHCSSASRSGDSSSAATRASPGASSSRR
jgi:hypothetical protein